jgi:RHS repeat-associated protein
MTKYDAFGEELRRSGSAVTRFGYQGTSWMRLGSGLLVSRTRTYQPTSGRFWQVDLLRVAVAMRRLGKYACLLYGAPNAQRGPAVRQRLRIRINWYAYLGSSPASVTDALGLVKDATNIKKGDKCYSGCAKCEVAGLVIAVDSKTSDHTFRGKLKRKPSFRDVFHANREREEECCCAARAEWQVCYDKKNWYPATNRDTYEIAMKVTPIPEPTHPEHPMGLATSVRLIVFSCEDGRWVEKNWRDYWDSMGPSYGLVYRGPASHTEAEKRRDVANWHWVLGDQNLTNFGTVDDAQEDMPERNDMPEPGEPREYVPPLAPPGQAFV